MKKLVVSSGSFNPPTLAHFNLLLQSLDHLHADIGVFMPASNEYLKAKMKKKGETTVYSDEDRIHMLSLYAKEDSRIKISLNEIVGEASSEYTYRSLCRLQKDYPGYELYYIVGGDNFAWIPSWHDIEDFLSSFHFLVFDRLGIDSRKSLQNSPILSKFSEKFEFITFDNELSKISSTEVRRLLREKNSEYRNYLLPSVAAYIESL